MRVSLYLFFLTLVLTLPQSGAAPRVSGTINSPTIRDDSFDEVSHPNAPGPHRFAIGFIGSSGSILEKGEIKSDLIYSLNYRNILDPRTLDIDIGIHSQAIARIAIGTRWSAHPDNSWLPYYKASLGMPLPAKDGPAGVSAIKRLQARLAIGAEATYDIENLQCEIALGSSVVGFEFQLGVAKIISF